MFAASSAVRKICMVTELFQSGYLRTNRNFLRKDVDRICTARDDGAARAGGLNGDEDYQISRKT
jgi:hypothetical protein